MATANFGTPHYNLPLVAVGITDDESQNEIAFWEMENNIKEINKELTYMEVVAESGYYQGAMYDLKDTCDYIDVEGGDLDTLDDYDANYFFGDTADNVRKDYKDDLEKVKAFLKDQVENWGAIELVRVAQFSNGETIYKQVEQVA